MVLNNILEKNSGFEGESEVAEFFTYRRIYVCIVRTAWWQSMKLCICAYEGVIL